MTTREDLNNFLDRKYCEARQCEETYEIDQFLLDKVGGVFLHYQNQKREGDVKCLFEPIDFDSSNSVAIYKKVLNSILDNCSGNVHIRDNIVKVAPREILAIVAEMPAGNEIDRGIGICFSIDHQKSDVKDLELGIEGIERSPFALFRGDLLSQYQARNGGDLSKLFDNFFEFLTKSEERLGETVEDRLLIDRSNMVREIIEDRINKRDV